MRLDSHFYAFNATELAAKVVDEAMKRCDSSHERGGLNSAPSILKTGTLRV